MKNRLEKHIRDKLKGQEILLMSHAVLGYPSFEDNRKLIAALVAAGVELIELQIPFSEPIADGPTLLKANHEAVKSGVSVDECLSFAKEICSLYPDTAFVFMTYYNILFSRGVGRFIAEAADSGVKGMIVPDLGLEEAGEYITEARAHDIATIFLVTPATPSERVGAIARQSRGLLYCVARRGVTGVKTDFLEEFNSYLARVRAQTELPLGVGFGVQSSEDIENLKGHAQIAIVCSQAIKLYVEAGADAVRSFMSDLR